MSDGENVKNGEISENAEKRPSDATEPETAQVSTEAPTAPETATGAVYENAPPPKKSKKPKTSKKTPSPELPGNEPPTEPTPEPTSDEPLTEPTPELTNDEPLTEPTPEPTSDEPPTENTVTPEPEIEALLEQNQCPRCGHNVTDPKRLSGKVAKYPLAGVHNGVPYQMIESRQIICDKCGQLFAVNKYI